MTRHLVTPIATLAASLVLAATAPPARAEEDPPPATRLAGASAVVGPEADIKVTDTNGRSYRGRLVGLTDTSLKMRDGERILTFEEARLRKVEAYRSDSVLNGLLIGVAVGAGTIVALGTALEAHESPEWAVATAVYGGIGGAVGAGIDALIRRKHTVFDAPARAPAMSIQPILAPGAQGMQLAVRF